MAACGKLSIVFVDEHGKVWTLGAGGPHLGLGTDTNTGQVRPACVGGCDLFGALVVSVAAGRMHNAAVAADGSLHTWGSGRDGRLGHGDMEVRWRPTRLGKELFAGSPAVHVACGHKHTVLITAAGRVWTCGSGEHGRLGHGDKENKWVMTQVGIDFGGAQIVYVAAGVAHSAAVGADGSVWTWGRGTSGCLGHNDEQDRLVPTTMADEVFGGVKVVLVAAGTMHTVAVADDGSFFVWGYGGDGQLGLGDNANRLAPTRMMPEAFRDSRVLTAACGSMHTLTVTEGGSIYSFGEGGRGMLGHNDEHNRPVPTHIEAQHFGDAQIVSVAAGHDHSWAVTADGVLFTWGRVQGLGHGDGEDKLVPTRVTPQLLQGPRVGRCHSIPLLPMLALAFAMGTHPRLGSAAQIDTATGGSRKSRRQQGTEPAATDTMGCAYGEMPGELVHQVVETCACVLWPEGRAGELEGVVRLLGGGIMKLRVST